MKSDVLTATAKLGPRLSLGAGDPHRYRVFPAIGKLSSRLAWCDALRMRAMILPGKWSGRQGKTPYQPQPLRPSVVLSKPTTAGRGSKLGDNMMIITRGLAAGAVISGLAIGVAGP